MRPSDYFGKWVRYTHVIQKEREVDIGKWRGLIKTIQELVERPGTGLCIGYRTIHEADTYIDTELGEFGTVLAGPYMETPVITKSIACLVVVPGPRENPIRISLDGVEIIGEYDND